MTLTFTEAIQVSEVALNLVGCLFPVRLQRVLLNLPFALFKLKNIN